MGEDIETKTEKNSSKEMMIAAYTGIPSMYVGYPCKAIEKIVQMKQRVTLNSRILYKGSTAYVGTFALTGVIQYGINAGLFGGKTQSDGQVKTSLAAAVGSGAFSALFSVHAENIIVRQHRDKLGLRSALHSLFKEGYLRTFRSVPLISLREMIYCPTNLIFVGSCGQYLKSKFNNSYLSLVGELAAGVTAATLSHPLERTATAVQKSTNNITSLEAAKEILRTEGYKGFFKGLPARAGLFCVVTPIMVGLRGPVSKEIYNNNYNFFTYPGQFFKKFKEDKKSRSPVEVRHTYNSTDDSSIKPRLGS